MIALVDSEADDLGKAITKIVAVEKGSIRNRHALNYFCWQRIYR